MGSLWEACRLGDMEGVVAPLKNLLLLGVLIQVLLLLGVLVQVLEELEAVEVGEVQLLRNENIN